MSNVESRMNYIYTQSGQRQLLLAMLTAGVVFPVLFAEFLSPVIVLSPVVVIGGTLFVRHGFPKGIPTWITFNCVSFFIIIYAAYTIGTTLPVHLLLLFLLGLLVYDVVGVETGKMQKMNQTMLLSGLPIVLLLPHSPEFSYDSFRDIIREDGLEGLHGSAHGVTMLGIGDAVLPAALGVGAGIVGTAYHFGPVTITTVQCFAALGGILGLAALIWADLPRPIAALTVSVPGALLGFVVGLLVDPTATLSWLPV
ncbi:presenilin family intramembrane aspartyl protease [Haloarcula sp. H-GB5]